LNQIVLPVFVCGSKVFGMGFWGNLGNSTKWREVAAGFCPCAAEWIYSGGQSEKPQSGTPQANFQAALEAIKGQRKLGHLYNDNGNVFAVWSKGHC
jgi:hypothetical protein